MSLILLAALAASSLPQEETPQRYRSVTVYGDEACPKPENENEVIVCARQDESERFRIPKRFRDETKVDAASQSWSNRTQTVMDANRVGLPGSCSPVGTGGQTGCNWQFLDQARALRKQQQAEEAAIP